MPRNQLGDPSSAQVRRFLRRRKLLMELGCPPLLPDEWRAPEVYHWFAELPVDAPITLRPTTKHLDKVYVGTLIDPEEFAIYVLREHRSPKHGVITVYSVNLSEISYLEATVFPSRAEANREIEEVLGWWEVQELTVVQIEGQRAA
ncbi:MAG TPA: hypothetical protein VNF73_09555 [Candidatus Saccharimonadales bacterium]|nr:hypothetical protein [Candidatus Saccharimonadales bacterium]